MRRLLLYLALLSLGVLVGGLLFSRTIPRSFLAIADCGQTCYRPSDLAGLLTSVGIQWAPGFMPKVARESMECLAVRHPKPEGSVHFVLFPKRDIRNILEITSEDQPFVFGCFALARQLISEAGASNYRLVTNGPALQHVAYLHFHLIAK